MTISRMTWRYKLAVKERDVTEKVHSYRMMPKGFVFNQGPRNFIVGTNDFLGFFRDHNTFVIWNFGSGYEVQLFHK